MEGLSVQDLLSLRWYVGNGIPCILQSPNHSPDRSQDMTSLSFLSARAAHRAASVCCAEHPCCMVRVCRSVVSLQTCREEHAVTTSQGTCQYPFPWPCAYRLSCSPYSRMRCYCLSRQESWNWLSPHDMHIWQYTPTPDSLPLREDGSKLPSPCQSTVFVCN